ncbi:tRNA uridine-5-carboxymethylaminomethyl(34) synthesis enzyme MnmG [Peptostreptococcus equinus]|uniref:tRNA uridine 5-carboxymethylaminomethyl modification enzyme MnmG n=1 Tax=Peptostreptococcus equinus TaxID=3003601 RepID=A0ABY7JNE9_9FIRM|nr:tRNA uridine-5-carboxymethylaminomethyl(34) synthesis enzyme MnmG [Peptostreptococcus sp. CBA3647]WAW14905.1 tRNA uridine-5-carboxymethylaminomethyl(34) synthesis enzyme MnmG [Peptostreptococcus sp. CBA3647]
MNRYDAGTYDIIVIGAGHAGCEAALASARMGMSTLMITLSLDSIAALPCNPSVGGTGKGQLVKEIDALGGQMGINIDDTYIQSRMLNTAKGPAVHSLRAQTDKNLYHRVMKETIENQENLEVVMDEVEELIKEGDAITGLITRLGAVYKSKAVILCTGVYLQSTIFIGHDTYKEGPNGLSYAKKLTDNLIDIGLRMRRFKTGTPARVHRDSIDFSVMEPQAGDEKVIPFSFMHENIERNQVLCYLTRTTPDTKKLIEDNISKSAMYSGNIEGVGPRYCPSIEDKIVKFNDKETHQLFIEPEGLDTKEMYVQGVSTSFPVDMQLKMYRTIKGLENVKIMRPAYAIEYDCIDPTQLNLSLEVKGVENLFSAGQFNGTSGYEEAAAQGLIAGINAVQKIKGLNPLIIDRSEGYIGVLIDDLVTKGTNEPYRMMTSRAEYRLYLRQDNADMRLTQKGYEIGLASQERYDRFIEKKKNIEEEIDRLKKERITPNEVNDLLNSKGLQTLNNGLSLYEFLKRPEINYDILEEVGKGKAQHLSDEVIEQAVIMIKYEGYIAKQMKQIDQFRKLEKRKLNNIDYNAIEGLRIEARQKLNDIQPSSIGQASRISGVSPSDISVLLIYLEQNRRKNRENKED